MTRASNVHLTAEDCARNQNLNSNVYVMPPAKECLLDNQESSLSCGNGSTTTRPGLRTLLICLLALLLHYYSKYLKDNLSCLPSIKFLIFLIINRVFNCSSIAYVGWIFYHPTQLHVCQKITSDEFSQ